MRFTLNVADGHTEIQMDISVYRVASLLKKYSNLIYKGKTLRSASTGIKE